VSGLAQIAFRAVCRRHPVTTGVTDFYAGDWAHTVASSEEFLLRMGGRLDVAGRSVLDIGCGTGALAQLLARRGAAHVHGTDIEASAIEYARNRLAAEAPELADRLTFQVVSGMADLGDRRFDVIVSKDSFEHFEDPEGFVASAGDHLTPGGVLAIGFGPTWKSPYGGHLHHMTRLPWAHLLFPEAVVMEERRRFSVGKWDGAWRYEEVTGGLNRMTYERFLRIMRSSGYRPVYFATNVRGGRASGVLNTARRIRGLREYLTFNLYGIWRRA
jgi:SAM-dependent methyltransferase